MESSARNPQKGSHRCMTWGCNGLGRHTAEVPPITAPLESWRVQTQHRGAQLTRPAPGSKWAVGLPWHSTRERTPRGQQGAAGSLVASAAWPPLPTPNFFLGSESLQLSGPTAAARDSSGDVSTPVASFHGGTGHYTPGRLHAIEAAPPGRKDLLCKS